MPTTATTYIEIGVNLAGVFQRGYAATHTEPGERDGFEDITIEGLFFEETLRKEINLLEGVDTTNPHVRRLLDNILNALGEAADEALMEEVGE